MSTETTTAQQPGCLPPGYNEHSMLTVSECAVWLGLSEREILEKYNKGRIPGAKFGQRTIRFHVGAIQTKCVKTTI